MNANLTNEPMKEWTSHFERRMDHTPEEWRGPLADVVDTADAVRLALKDWEIDDSALLLGLTRLVLERHDKQADAQPPAH